MNRPDAPREAGALLCDLWCILVMVRLNMIVIVLRRH